VLARMLFPIVVMGVFLSINMCCAQSVEARLEVGAQTRFDAANHYFEDGDYEHALEEFKAAYDLSDRAAMLYNISLCYERLADLPQAIQYLERYAQTLTPGDERTHVEVKMNHMYERLHQQMVEEGGDEAPPQSDSEARSAADGMETRGAGGPDGATNALGDSGRRSSLAVPLAITSLATAVVSVSLGALAWHQHRTLPAPCPDGCGSGARSRLKAYDLTADIALVLSIGSGVAALVWGLRHPHSTERSTPSVDVVGSSRSAIVVMGGSF